jgi:hypothetical protein
MDDRIATIQFSGIGQEMGKREKGRGGFTGEGW